jgi:hypothetical protein
MPQNQQLDVLGEIAAAAKHEQPQQRRKREIRKGKEHPPMLPERTVTDSENRNLVLKPLTCQYLDQQGLTRGSKV